jgi:CheY-like chemotaxis protein
MQTKPVKILLAEDDRDDVEIFKLALEDLRQPFELIQAKNGRRLLELLPETAPDVIFLDIRMPYENGFGCVKEIRKNRAYNHIPIIVITSLKNQENIGFMFANKVSFYIVKSYSITELAGKLKYIFTANWNQLSLNVLETAFVLG